MLPTDTRKPAKPTKPARTDRIDIRLTSAQKELLEHATALQGRTVTAFILASAEEAAHKAIKEHETVRLSERDREVFVDALLNPPRPSDHLRTAAATYLKEMGLG